MVEPTVVLCRCGDGDLRVPIWPDRGDYDGPRRRVVEHRGRPLGRCTVEAPGPPSQVEVDPDHALLDAGPDNNRWKPEVAWRLTPLMTPLDESSQFQAYDRVSVVAGPFIDQYARGGLQGRRSSGSTAGRSTGWAGTEPALREAIFGGQAELFHFPWPSTGRPGSSTRRGCTTSTTTGGTPAAAPSSATGSWRRRASWSTTRGSSSCITAWATSSGPATTAGRSTRTSAPSAAGIA